MNRVTVIVVNWNRRRYLVQCLNSLRQQSFEKFSTIVVDNGSTDDSVEYVKKRFPEVNLISLEKNLGFAVANNIAFQKTTTEYAALLNNDATAHRLWLENMVNALDSEPEAGCAASKVVFYNDPEIIDRAGDIYTTAGAAFFRGRGRPRNEFDQPARVFGASAAATIYRVKWLRQIGFFDEDFFLIYEDVDLSFRLQLSGRPCLYVPEALVYHRGSESIGTDTDISIYYGHRNLEWVYIKNMPLTLILQTAMLHLLYDVLSFVFFLVRGKGRVYMRAKVDALKKVKIFWKKRKFVQSHKRVDNRTLFRLMEKEHLKKRLSRRRKNR